MIRYRKLSDAQAANTAEAALCRRFSPQTRVSSLQRIGERRRRNLIFRAIATLDDEPRGIIIKATRALDYDASAPDAFEKSGLVKEWIARERYRDPLRLGDQSHSRPDLACR